MTRSTKNGETATLIKRGAVTFLVLAMLALTQWGVSLNSKVVRLEATLEACKGL